MESFFHNTWVGILFFVLLIILSIGVIVMGRKKPLWKIPVEGYYMRLIVAIIVLLIVLWLKMTGK